MIRGLILALAAIALFLGPFGSAAAARDLTGAEGAALAEKVAAYDAAMRRNDFAAVTDAMPPRLLKHMADLAQAPLPVLRTLIIEQTAETMTLAKLHSFSMDLGSAKHRQLPDGEPYVLIPTETVIEVEGRKVQTNTETLALLDEGKWYLLRIASAEQSVILTEIYPQFKGVAFSGATTKVLAP